MRLKQYASKGVPRQAVSKGSCLPLLFTACVLETCLLVLVFLFPSTFFPLQFSASTPTKLGLSRYVDAIAHRYYHNANTSTTPRSHSTLTFNTDIINNTMSTTNTISVLAMPAISNAHLKGVAVTVFLHAPKWFATRYTLMVQNIIVNLPIGWKVQIFHSGSPNSGYPELNIGLQRLIANGIVELTKIPDDLLKKKRKKKELLTDVWLWQNVLADKVLVFGGNAALCGNTAYEFSAFSGYDYIGARWSSFGGQGGDGGLSFRSASVMIRVIERELSRSTHGGLGDNAYLSWGVDDKFFVSRILEMNAREGARIKIADVNATVMFAASEISAHIGAFGASMTLARVDHEERDAFLKYCLELKVIFPSLHNPACFGAHPQPDECRQSICALRVPRKKGGC